MIERDLIKAFIDAIYCKPPEKIYETNKIIYNQIDETWSIDLVDMIDYKTSIKKRFRYIFIIIDIFSKFSWCGRLKIKNSQKVTQEFSNIPSTSKRIPNKIASGRGKEF